MKFLNFPVRYLQISDFDQQGNLINPEIPKDKPVIIMIQSSGCGHCTTAKPAYQQFANQTEGKVFVTTIQADGEMPGEKELGPLLQKIDPSFRGFPHYVGYKNGRKVATHEGGRSVQDLMQFAATI